MSRGMVCAAQPEAAEAGADILRAGGNVVDAAIGAALVQTAVDPQMCGIAGMGTMQLYLPARSIHTTIDFHARAPFATQPDMWQELILREADDGWGFILRGRVNELGYESVGTPMTLRAFDVILRRFGTRPIAELLQPAIEYCEEGFLIRPHVSEFWHLPPRAGRDANIDIIGRFPATRKIYTKNGGMFYATGEMLRNPDMGRTYRRIAQYGADDFYTGEIAHRIVRDMAKHSGLLSQDDLASCTPEESPPLFGSYRSFRIATNNPPGGGIQLIEMLNILEQFDLAAMGHNSPEYIRVVSEAMKIATVDKDTSIGDPRFVHVPVNKLTSKDYAARMAERIRRHEKTDVPRLNTGGRESSHTTHICVMDPMGNAATMTHTLGQPSGVVTEGLGFMYNGAMSVFDPRAGYAGSLAPGKARFSAMSPTIVFKRNTPFLVLGAPGATYITMGNLQAMLNVMEFGMDARQAVSEPRFAAVSDRIELSNRILRSAERALQTMGYATQRHAKSYEFARVHAIRCVDGGLDGGADPNGGGMALSV